MNRMLLATVCACTLALAGCMGTSKPVPIQRYTLAGPMPPPFTDVAPPAPNGKTLAIARFVVSPWLDGTIMHYRLTYQHDARLGAYGRSAWAAPPATMLEPIVQAVITIQGGWLAVVGPHNPAAADATLRIRISQFGQVFTQPDHSNGVVAATVTLVAGDTHAVVAQKQFRVAVPSASANAQGGAAALGYASRQFATQLAQWLAKVAARK